MTVVQGVTLLNSNVSKPLVIFSILFFVQQVNHNVKKVQYVKGMMLRNQACFVISGVYSLIME